MGLWVELPPRRMYRVWRTVALQLHQRLSRKLQVHETCTDMHGPVQKRRLLLVLGRGRHHINIRIRYVNTCLTLNWNLDKVQ